MRRGWSSPLAASPEIRAIERLLEASRQSPGTRKYFGGEPTDPYAKGPAPHNHWIATGAHVMVVGPAVKAMTGYPKSADPDTTKPYVMWAGTPYEHLMIPVR